MEPDGQMVKACLHRLDPDPELQTPPQKNSRIIL